MATLKDTIINDNSFIGLPAGTTGQRPSSPAAGMIRYNTTIYETEYFDGTVWRSIGDTHPQVTGGTVSDVDIGGVAYRIHTFTSTGNSTFTVSKPGEVDYLIVAGGGGGGGRSGGGGGAGGLITGTTTVTAQSYTITVGAGGAGGAGTGTVGGNGSNSSAFGLTAFGGGGGGSDGRNTGADGGSGGGGRYGDGGGSATQPGSSSGGFGNNGASGTSNTWMGGGGGGAGSPGIAGTNTTVGNGGHGLASSISGTNQFYAAGGGGGSHDPRPSEGRFGYGGLGGGGDGGKDPYSTSTDSGSTGADGDNGVNGTGSGGGGGSTDSGSGGGGGNGGSGIVIIRYRRNTTLSSPDIVETSTVPYVYPSKIRDTRNFISTNGLQVNLDAFDPLSYTGTSSTWTDLTGNAYNATLENSPEHYDAQGYISFNGSNQRATTSVPGFNSGSQAYTFEVLFRMRTLPTAQYTANGHILGGQIGNNLVLYVNPASNGRSTLNMNHDDARYSATGAVTNGTIGANEWVHWIVSWDFPGFRYTHYLNGKRDKAGQGTLGGQEARGYGNGFIAYDSRWQTYSELDIAVIRQYNRVLGYDEVLQNFNAVRGRFGI